MGKNRDGSRRSRAKQKAVQANKRNRDGEKALKRRGCTVAIERRGHPTTATRHEAGQGTAHEGSEVGKKIEKGTRKKSVTSIRCAQHQKTKREN